MSFFKTASPVRKAFMGLGAATFVAGIILLGVGGYSALSGDDEPPEAPLVDLGDRTPSPTPRPTATEDTGTPAPTPVPAPPLGDNPYTMIIPKIGVNNQVETAGLDDQQVPQVPSGDNAADVVVWYNFSAKPGVGGNAVFAGHVTWFGAAVFYNLTSLAAGDDISLLGQDGTQLNYKVSEVFQVDANDPDSLTVMHATTTDVLTIITCDGAYTDTNDPVSGGEYSHRLVVRAALESVTPGAAVAAGG